MARYKGDFEDFSGFEKFNNKKKGSNEGSAGGRGGKKKPSRRRDKWEQGNKANKWNS